MKNNFTKLMAIVAVLLMSAWSVNAQTELRFVANASSTTSYTFNTTDVLYAVDGTSFSTNTSTPCFTGETFQKRIQQKVFILELKSTSCSAITLHGTSSGTTSTRTIYKIEVADTKDGTYTEVENITNPTTTITSNIYGTATCGESSATNLNIAQGKFVKISICTSASSTSVQNINLAGIDITALPSGPKISKFVAEGVEATINESAKTITAELPYGSSLTSITPTVTIGGTATDYSPKGAQDFTNPVTYTAIGSPADVDYTVTLTVNPTPSSDKDLSNVTIGGKTPTFDANTNTYSIILPKASSLTQTVSFTKPSTATANFTSGNSHDFTNPLQITVTAQDGSTKVYTLTAQVGSKNIAYIINTAVDAKDTKIRPMLASKYYLENIPILNVTTTYDFSSYDMVILTEAPSSGSAGMKALWGINKPLLSLKMYAIQANTWNLSTASNPSPAATGVAVNEPNHPIFNGVTWTGTYGNEIEMFDAISSGNGVQTTPYTGIYNLANVKGLSTTGILELPVGTTSPMSGTTNANLQQKLLFVSISNDNQNIVTDNALKIIDNAVNYLTGSTVWGTDAGTEFMNMIPTGYSVVTSNVRAMLYWDAIPGAVKYIISKIAPATVKGINYVKSDVNAEVDGSITEFELLGLTQGTEYTYEVVGQNALGTNSAPKTFNFTTWWTGVNNATINGVTFDGKIIHNANHQLLNVFDATGRLIINSHEDINMSAQAKGVYLVKGENGMMKIAVTK